MFFTKAAQIGQIPIIVKKPQVMVRINEGIEELFIRLVGRNVKKFPWFPQITGVLPPANKVH